MPKESKADIQELSEYVFVHPDDYERRWTLAKKLYMAWEYNDSLKHLLILKKNWSRKLNVLRYLAATYYRLGLYDEAIAELRSITELWPSEVAVWEQLARVYEVAGRTADAAHTWEQIVRISPSHPTAARSVQRLRSPSDDARRDDLRLRDSDSGIDLSPYRICRNCGAQNSDEFERCWQCHSTLRSEEAPIDSMHLAIGPKSKAWLRTLIGGMSTVAAVTASVYVTLHTMRAINQGIPSGNGPVYDVLADALLAPRLVCAGVLGIAWPAALWIAFRFTGARPLPWPSLFGAGLLLSSLTYLCMWAPVPWLLYAPIVPAMASLIVILTFGGAAILRGVAAWFSHGVFVLAAAVGAFTAMAGVQPIVQMPAIVDYHKTMSALTSPESLPILATVGSGGCFVKWLPTSSSWLDRYGNTIVVVAIPEQPDTNVALTLFSGDESIANPCPIPNSIVASVITDTIYTLRITVPEGISVAVRSRGALQPIDAGKLME